MADAHQPAEAVALTTPGDEPRPAPLRPFLLALVASLGAVAVGFAAHGRLERDLSSLQLQELGAVVTLKAEQASRWRAEQLAGAGAMARAGAIGRALASPTRDEEARRALSSWLDVVRSGQPDDLGIAVLDAGRQVQVASGAAPPGAGDDGLAALLDQAARQREPVLSSLHATASGTVQATLVAPVAPNGGPVVGFLVLRVDPEPGLLAPLRRWPLASRSARAMLLQSDGRRFEPVGASTWQRPGDDLVTRVAEGARGVLLAQAGGRPVLASAQLVPGAPWILLGQEDAEEAFEPLRAQALALQVGVAVLVLAFLGVALLWFRLQQAGHERRRERSRAEREVYLKRIELLSRQTNDIMLLADIDQRVVDVNERACELLGYSREELIGMPVLELRDPATADDFEERRREELTKGTALFETRYRRKDGSTFPAEVSVRAAELDGKRYFQGIIRDITERRRLELQLQLADRMASVGTLASGVAHEINDPLSYLLANLDFALADRTPAGPLDEVGRALREARQGAVKIQETVRDLRTFSRAGDQARQRVDLRRVLQAAVSLAQTEIRHVARLSLELGDTPAVMADEHRLGQALLNLLMNAAQAISPGSLDRNLVNAATGTAQDGRALIEITDTGAGIRPEVLPRIFDPFFTTRSGGGGTGLGLAIVHGIVTDLGGEVRVQSDPGHGSIFTVLLPPAPAETAAAPPPTQPVAEPVGARTGKVLVVDDEPLVGRAVVRILAPPHQVTVVTSADEALGLLDQGSYDVILCDLMMPGMTGMALYDLLVERSPAVAERIIFLTGGASAEPAARFLSRVPNVRLEKPFDPRALRTAVAAEVSKSTPA